MRVVPFTSEDYKKIRRARVVVIAFFLFFLIAFLFFCFISVWTLLYKTWGIVLQAVPAAGLSFAGVWYFGKYLKKIGADRRNGKKLVAENGEEITVRSLKASEISANGLVILKKKIKE